MTDTVNIWSSRDSSKSAERGFWWVACSIAVVVMGANTLLPILTVYQSKWAFSTALLTVVYGLYTAGVLVAVFGLGSASDLVGRKRVLLPALGTMALPPDRRAQIFSAFQLGLYVGATVPAILVGVAAGRFGLAAACVGFAAAVSVLAVFALGWLMLRRSAAHATSTETIA